MDIWSAMNRERFWIVMRFSCPTCSVNDTWYAA
jgi:hypothetical protein